MNADRSENVDGHFVHVFDGLFDPQAILRFHHSMLIANFSCLQASKEETRKFKEWVASFDVDDFAEHWLAQACEKILNEMPETSGKTYRLRRVFCNLFSFGSYTFSHNDSGSQHDADGEISFLYMVNHEWDHEWGGETIIFNDQGEPQICVGVKPGRLVVFDGAIIHRAGVPTRYCDEHRLTFSLRFAPTSDT